MPSKCRPSRWTFTWNNPPNAYGSLLGNLVDSKIAKYVCGQLEQGKNGTNHFQGYIEFNKQTTLKKCKECIPGAHWEISGGTGEENKKYCTKEETRIEGPWEWGVMCAPGTRTDLLMLKEVLDTKSLKEAWQECFPMMLKYHRGAEKYKQIMETPRDKATILEIHIGAPGTGKTTGVLDDYPGAMWMNSSGWWDFYEGQKVVVIDEFCGWLPYNVLLKLADPGPYSVNVKGTMKQFVSERVVIISNTDPDLWYAYGERLQWEALERRIDRDHSLYYHRKEGTLRFDSYKIYKAAKMLGFPEESMNFVSEFE